MKAESHAEHTGAEAHVVVDPVRRTAVVAESRHMSAYPDPDICQIIKIPGLRIWFVLIKWRSPVDSYAAQDEAEQNWHIQPVAPSH
jgi:hypothetical protein